MRGGLVLKCEAGSGVANPRFLGAVNMSGGGGGAAGSVGALGAREHALLVAAAKARDLFLAQQKRVEILEGVFVSGGWEASGEESNPRDRTLMGEKKHVDEAVAAALLGISNASVVIGATGNSHRDVTGKMQDKTLARQALYVQKAFICAWEKDVHDIIGAQYVTDPRALLQKIRYDIQIGKYDESERMDLTRFAKGYEKLIDVLNFMASDSNMPIVLDVALLCVIMLQRYKPFCPFSRIVLTVEHGGTAYTIQLDDKEDGAPTTGDLTIKQAIHENHIPAVRALIPSVSVCAYMCGRFVRLKNAKERSRF